MGTDQTQVYNDLEGRTALVTGSSKNIGRATAVALAEVGVDIGVTGHSDRKGCEETARQIEEVGSAAAIKLGDLGEIEDVDDIIDHVQSKLGPISILVNNAAIRPHDPFDSISLEEWEQVMNVNLRSGFHTAKRVLPDMRETGKGDIVHVTGLIGMQGRKRSVPVTVSKAGIFGLTRSLAADLGSDNIRVNNVVPGRKLKTVRDTITERDKEQFEILERATPLGRRSDPEEVAKVIRFLVSEEASFVNGEIIKVDGGLSNSQTGAHLY